MRPRLLEHLVLRGVDGPCGQHMRGRAVGVVPAEHLHVVVIASQVGQGPAEGGDAGRLGGLAEPAGIMRRRDRRRDASLAGVGGDPVGEPPAVLLEPGGLRA